ncbi:MAG: hypothetical protein DRJ59_06000 [Thermoprotei archaeon]|nr:MAG: hypothetical protein DRJ59_06000 [Thermoprotei archaeon]
MDSRERIYSLLHLEEADRVGYVDFFWSETRSRWEQEGLPKDVFLCKYFGMDIYIMGVDVSPKFDTVTLEEGKEWVVVRDAFGVLIKRWRAKSGTPFPLAPAVRTLEEFKEYFEPLLDPELPMRVSSSKYPFKGDLEKALKKMQEEFFVVVGVLGPFEYVRHILGSRVDNILRYFYKDPKMLEHIFDVVGHFLSKLTKAFLDIGVDGVWVWDDVGYNRGPFISPKMYKKFVQPQHRRIVEQFRNKNLPAILHTDGNVNILIDHFIDAGFTALQPLEAKAGMDVRVLKEKYGDRLAFIGNIDVRALSSGPEAIKKEVLSKLPIAATGGGYIGGSDHSVPPTVSLENYRLFTRILKKYGRYPLRRVSE